MLKLESILAVPTPKSTNYLTTQEGIRVRLESIVQYSDDAIITKDLDGTVTSWNAAAVRIFGYTPEEIIGKSILTIIPPELHQEEQEILSKLRQGNRIDHYETIRLAKDGSRVSISLTVSPIKDESGQVIGASQIARDLRENIRADELRVCLAAIVESSDDAIVSKDLNGIITSWNAAAESLLGWKAAEIIGRSVLSIIPKELQYEEPEILRKLRAGERITHFDTRRQHKDGHLLDVSLTISPIRDGKGRVVGASKILRDMTERNRLQRALIDSEKLAATGRMAATIAHEINNPLEAMTNLGYLLCRDNSLSAEAKLYASMLLEQIERTSEIAKQTLSFYRQSTKPVEIDICRLTDSVLSLNRAVLERKRIRVRREYANVENVLGFRTEIHQVLANLILNSADAVSDNGEICVKISSHPIRSREKCVRVTVFDNGHGIPESIKGKLFQPFFTTKSEGGNGLGLWVSRGIIERHGGQIRVRSRTANGNSGTAFSLTLPQRPKYSSEP